MNGNQTKKGWGRAPRRWSTATTSTHRMTHSPKTLMPANGNVDPAASYSMISRANSLGEARQYDCVTVTSGSQELETQIQPPCRPPGVVTEPGVIHSSPPCRALDRFSQSKHMPVSCPVTKEEREFGSFQRPNGRWGVTRWSLIRPDFQTAGPLPLGRRRSALVQRWEGFR